jgi:micrococcal nuclease
VGRRALCLFAVVLAVVLVAACSSARAGKPSGAAPNGAATIDRVVDGDTLVVRVSGRRERVRLIGMDTPESVKPNTPVQCFAVAASNRTKALLPAGTPVRLVGDVEQRDRYKRLLAYVYRVRDNLFVNLTLVREGYAVPYTFPPNVAHTDEFVAAARDARDAGHGLWSACGPDQRPSHPDVATVKGSDSARRAIGLPP